MTCTCIDGRVDGDGPHGGRVAVAVAVVVLAAVAAGPHVDVAETLAALKNKTLHVDYNWFLKHKMGLTFFG